PGGLHEVKAPESPADWLPPVCRGLAEGQVSGVIETPGGYGIARLEKVTPGGVPSFVEAQRQIREILRRQKAEARRKQVLVDLRRKVPVEYFPPGRRIAGPRRRGE
ncbi:MAG: peptidyl-prolyl cis-trans isomerase, partial [Candidatus Brocadiia bacterium]|nr:peptidyl-prolyl cis-trans isomerase [Candidatus Brocadiia bacterium]